MDQIVSKVHGLILVSNLRWVTLCYIGGLQCYCTYFPNSSSFVGNPCIKFASFFKVHGSPSSAFFSSVFF